jgi:hypothetical protein
MKSRSTLNIGELLLSGKTVNSEVVQAASTNSKNNHEVSDFNQMAPLISPLYHYTFQLPQSSDDSSSLGGFIPRVDFPHDKLTT